MKRRTFLAGVAGTSGMSMTLAKPAIAQNKRQLTMVAAWAKNKGGTGIGSARLARHITEASDGELTVKLYWGGELVKSFEAFDAVSRGDADMYHGAEYYWHKKSPGFSFFTSVPFGMTPQELDTWVHSMGGQELWDELSGRYDIKAFPAGYTGPQMGGWHNKEIRSLNDLKGLRFRIPGIGGDVIKRAGGTPVSLPREEIVPALKAGTIDGAEWVGPWPDTEMGFYRVAKYYYYPGFHEPSTMYSCGIRRKVWEGLSKSHQEIIRIACLSEARQMLVDHMSNHGVYLNQLISQHGVKMRRFPSSVLNSFGKISGEVLADYVAGDSLLERIHSSFIDARAKLLRWAKYSDEAFLVARRLPFHYGRPSRRSIQAPSIEAAPEPKKPQARWNTIKRL